MNYDKVAKYYQRLSRCVFGDALLNAQRTALKTIDSHSSILIVGGGDGEVLPSLQNHTGRIDFVEISAQMIALAKQKSVSEVNWFNQDIFDFSPTQNYDTVFLPFLLDNFTDETTEKLILKLKSFLKTQGKLLVVDFTEKPNLWQKILLRSMYLFFQGVACVKVKTLPKMEETILKNGFEKRSTTSNFRGFIEGKVYE